MLQKSKSPILLGLVLILSACGGGSDDSTSPPQNITPPVITNPDSDSDSDSDIIKNATQYSSEQLKTAAESLAKQRYLGTDTSADIDIVIAQDLFKKLFNSEMQQIPDLALEHFAENLDSNRNIDVTTACDYLGNVSFKGQFDTAGQGNVEINYNGCQNMMEGPTMSGQAAFSVLEANNYDSELAFYFDDLHWADERGAIGISGYLLLSDKSNSATGENTQIANQKLLYSVGQEQQLLEMIITETYWGEHPYTLSMNGSFFDSENGKITVNTEDLTNNTPHFINGSITFSGGNKIELEFDYNHVKYIEDSNSDGMFDLGTYFSGTTELINGTVSDKTLVTLDNMSLPPFVEPPWLITNNIDTTKPIELREGWYDDPDTPRDELSVSFRWYINSELITGETSATLPAYIAVFGDEVKATMVVADSSNAIESSSAYIYIEDAPAQIQATNLPDMIQEGDQVQFSVIVSDPDMLDDESSADLISAPTGASIDANGTVTWEVSNDFLFPYQTYDFTFGVTDAVGNTVDKITVSLDVSSDKPLPITRSGIEVPSNNMSMLIGDYDGDGKNEILATDNRQRLFLLAEVDGKYAQKWLYPFALPTRGDIIQVLSYDIDQDGVEEILAVTTHGVSIIDGIDTLAYALFATTDYIQLAAIADLNNDESLEIAYLYTEGYSSSDNTNVNVINISSPNDSLFSSNLGDAKQIIFADVDNEPGLELISNNGLIYDAITWENEWYSSTSFGDNLVTSGDYNGDGINEIAGASRWGEIAIFSATDKAQLATLGDVNICSINTANVDNDTADELLIGDCQWGDIHAYKLNGNELIEHWAVDMQDHGSSSLVVGDSDNDGAAELHWGTGITHSGENSLVVADLTATSAVIKTSDPTVQYYSFNSAGWSKITEEKERAVFFIPRTSSGYGGSRVVTMDSNGDYEVSEEISSNWDGSKIAVTTDYNNDGFGDIFLPSTNLYDGSFSAMQLFDYSLHWQSNADHNSNIGIIKAYDINGDGIIDANYVDGTSLNFIDIDNETIIAKYTFDSYINDFESYQDTDSTVFVARNNALSLLTVSGASLAEQSFIEQSCTRLSLINYDLDAEKELLCINNTNLYDYTSDIYIYNIENKKLVETEHFQYDHNITDVAIDQSTANEQNFFLSTQRKQNDYGGNSMFYSIEKLNAKGQILWRSPAVVGKPSEHSLKMRYSAEKGTQLMLSTVDAMYLIN